MLKLGYINNTGVKAIILSSSDKTFTAIVLLIDELVTAIIWDPKLVKYIVKTTVPPVLANEVVPNIFVEHANTVLDTPVNKLLSSPFNVTVIVNWKLAVGV